MSSERVIRVVGSLHMDLVFQTERFPVPGETLRGTSWLTRPGGKGRNQAASAVRFCPKVGMVGAVGDDTFAEDLLTSLTTVGVDTRLVRKVLGDASGVSVAIIEPGGDSESVIVSGVNLRIPDDIIQAFAHSLRSSDVVILQNEVSTQTNEQVAELCARKGTTVILNAAPHREVTPVLRSNVGVLIVNEVEAGHYTGSTPVSKANAKEAIDTLFEQWRAEAVVITLGKDGVVYRRRGEPAREISACRVPSSDAHGAGDAFVGALAGRLIETDDFDDAVRFGNAAAAATIATPFSSRHTIGPAEVQSFLDRA